MFSLNIMVLRAIMTCSPRPIIAQPIGPANAALNMFWKDKPCKNVYGNGRRALAVSMSMATITYPAERAIMGRYNNSFDML